MLRDKIILLLVFLLTLNSCSFLRGIFGNEEISEEIRQPSLPDPNNVESSDLTPTQIKFIEKQCISDPFREKDKNNLYGKECLEGRSLVVEALRRGANIISTSAVTGTGEAGEENGSPAVKLEGPPDFINQVYRASYQILQQEGDAEHYSFLTDLFPLGKDFNASFKEGSQKTRYHIIFKVEGNYLVLYKASKDLKDIPYIERSSMPFDRKVGKYQPDENGFYKVPFLGWLIEHCTTDYDYADTGERLSIKIPVCGSSNDRAKSGKYIKIDSSVPELYSYQVKKDLFPTDYFDGEWFFSSGRIEGPASIEDIIAPTEAYFVTLDKQKNSLLAIDQSGDIISGSDKRVLNTSSFPVKWVEYEPDKIGAKVFKSFGEKLKENREDEINTSFMLFDFDNFSIEVGGNKEKAEVIELLISDNYFSFVAKANWTPVDSMGKKEKDNEGNPIKYSVRYRFSLLRVGFLDQKGFKPKKLFSEDDEHIFGTLFVTPQDIRTLGDVSLSDSIEHIRSIRFNTSLNTEEEKRSKTKVIKWYFSKNSTKDQKYRDIAHRAIEIYNRAFEIITADSNQKIKVELAGDIKDDKELGDMRYNIINLVQTDQIGRDGSLFGIAPSYVHSNTGQIIGTTSNVIVHTIEDIYINKVWEYVRYEIFYKDAKKESNETFKTHLVTPYFASRITAEPDCKPVMDFIKETKEQKNLPPDTELNDKELRIKCGKKLAENKILSTLLHELGHNFGLGHNFKGSIDKANYYKDIKELRALFPTVPENTVISKSSTVMEYLPPVGVPLVVYLGKYDLAALRYIYMDQVEKKSSSDEDDVEFLSLDIPKDPDKQTPIPDDIKSQMKPYQHCSTYVAFVTRLNEDFHCVPHDYGSNPTETVQFFIDQLKRTFNFLRYRYDTNRLYDKLFFSKVINNGRLIKEIELFYKEWIKLRNKYLSVASPDILTYDVSDPDSTHKYTEIINNGLNDLKGSDYALYYPVRELISDFLMDFLFLESMQCLIKDRNLNTERFINLNFVTIVLESSGNPFYVKDCYSPDIKSFFESQNYELIGQKGFESFTYYENLLSSNQANKKWNIDPIGNILINNLNEKDKNNIPERTKYLLFTYEPDLLHKFRLRLENNLLDDKNGFSPMEFLKDTILYENLIRIFLEIRNVKRYIGQKNINYLLYRKFEYGFESNSFNHFVARPLLQGIPIEVVAEKIPFLKDAYYQYRDFLNKDQLTPQEILSFRKWMCAHLDKVLCSKEEGSITVPFNSENFSAKLIKKYNDLKSRVIKLQKKGADNLTIFDRIDIYRLTDKMDELQKAISLTRQKDENPL